MNLLKKIRTISLIIIISLLCSSCYDMHPAEDISIVLGIGYDIEKDNEIRFVDPAELLKVDKDDKAASFILTGEGDTIYSLVENRTTKQSKKFILGTEVVYIISEERAVFGIEDMITDALKDPKTNTTAYVAVNKGKCKDLFSLKSSHSGTTSEILHDMIRFSYQGNFFSKDFTMNDIFLMYHQQGREIYIPYIEIIDNNPEITGVALFKNDKMIKKISIKEAKLINLIRFSGGKGYLSIPSPNPLKYLSMSGQNKVKVKVSKENERLKYDIFVDISGVLKIDTLYKEDIDKKQVSKIEDSFASELQKQLNEEVTKVQEDYPVDCLDITKYALAEFGRDSGYDDFEYFKNADIDVHVSVKITSIGRTHSEKQQ